MKRYTIGLVTCALGIGMAGSAQAALVANFDASSYDATANTLTDSVSGIVATGSGTHTYDAATHSVNTDTGGFKFDIDSALPGLHGSTTYTLAVGFTYNLTPGQPGGAYAYQGQGVFGGDIPNSGQGDAGIAITGDPDGQGQIVATTGHTTGNDVSAYDVNVDQGTTSPLGAAYNFVPGSPTGVVFVVSTNGTQLYVNGVDIWNGSYTSTPFGEHNDGTDTSSYEFGIGAGPAVGLNAALNGSIRQAQIYDTSLDAATAKSLSRSIAGLAPVPEPASLVLLSMGAGLLLVGRRRGRVA